MRLTSVEDLRADLQDEEGEAVSLDLKDRLRRRVRVNLVPKTIKPDNLFVRAKEYDQGRR